MKKIYESGKGVCPIPKKLLLVMKLTAFLIVVLTMQVTATVYSQNKKLSLNMQGNSIKEVLQQIEAQSEYRFIYENEKVNLETKVSIRVTDEAVDKILKQLFDKDGVSYTITDSNMILINPSQNQMKNLGKESINSQQQKSVSGKVTDSSGGGLPGVSVVVKGTTTGVITDSDGNYSLNNIPENCTLVFSFVGMKTQEVIVGGKSTINITLSDETIGIEEVVAVGYGVQKKKDVTTSVSNVRAKDLENQPVSNVSEAIVGKMAGVQITQGSGQPGKNLDFKVRGVGTITAGSTPLYVVDGIPLSAGSSLSTINTSDIESIEVLKDASSAAIYGSRGSNGVVIITTKQGKSGKAIISYGGYSGIQSVSKKIKMMDAYQYSSMTQDARNNTYSDAMIASNAKLIAAGKPVVPFSLSDSNGVRLANTGKNTNTIIPDEILPYLQNQPGLTNTNWQDQIYRIAPIQNHTISATGGSDNMRYYTSLEYFGQDGVVINSDFQRFGAKINIDGNRGIFKYGLNINPSVITENLVNTDGPYSTGGVIASALHSSPIFPVYNANGSYSFAQNAWSGNATTTLPDGTTVAGNSQTYCWNPVALAMLVKDEATHLRVMSNFYVEAAIARGIKYKVSFGTDLSNNTEDYYRPSSIPLAGTASNPNSVASAWSKYYNETNWILEQTLSVNKKIGEHTFDFLAGWTTQKDKVISNYVYAGKGFISDQITTLSAGIVTGGNSQASEYALASGLARLQYNYQGKYLLSVAVRADGASRFGENNKWGYFPSASAGWRISQEKFMTKYGWLNDLKLRASYGLTGNFNIPNYGALGTVAYNSYILGNTTPSAINGAAPTAKPNPLLSWEKTNQTNLGIDISILNSAYTLNVDVYNSNTNDLLLNVPVPITTGYTSELTNVGKVNNKGIELGLTFNHSFGKVKWQGNLNYSKNINEVKQLGPGNADIIVSDANVTNAYFITRVGEAIGSYYLPVVLGVFKTQAEIDAYPHYTDVASNYGLATSKPGDFKFKDVDGDKTIDMTKDRAIVGNYMPKFTYGFSNTFTFKNFDLAFALQGVYGNKILNLSRRYFYNGEGNMNNYIGGLNRWQSESDPGSGWNVRANRVAKGQNGTPSTWLVEDGSYLRVRNITLGYTLSDALIKKVNISKTRIYVTIQNPFTSTKYEGYNPEVSNRSTATSSGVDYGVYPVTKSVIIGLNITL